MGLEEEDQTSHVTEEKLCKEEVSRRNLWSQLKFKKGDKKSEKREEGTNRGEKVCVQVLFQT